MKEKTRLKSSLIYGGAAITLVLATSYWFHPEKYDKKTGVYIEDGDDLCKQLAASNNKQLPMRLDSLTMLDSAVAMPGSQFKYCYTLINFHANPLLLQNLKPTLIKRVQATEIFNLLAKNEIIFHHIFYDSTRQIVADVVLTPEDYKQELPNDDFTIELPYGWTHSSLLKESPTLKLNVEKIDGNPRNKPQANMGISAYETGDTSLSQAYSNYLAVMRKEKSFKLQEEGRKFINGKEFNWVINTTIAEKYGIEMKHYVLLTIHKPKVYILDCGTFSDSFDKYKPEFDKAANSWKFKD